MIMDSSQWVSEADRLTYLRDGVQSCSDGTLKQHLTLFLETPQPERTSDMLRKRINAVLGRTREATQRVKLENAIESKISGTSRRSAPRKVF